ncbi:hypothetical protein ACSBPQ_14645 [Stenotrophomonas sp. JC08]|uniref:hypothetical protein n=1 Tax=Stenotrophomonas sp. JC08 TaxID=3445779 RepID=UPI003FA2F064
MLKKLVLIVIVLLLALAQSYFIYAVQHGADDAFAGAWSSFNVAQSEYSQFVFRTIKWWWALPVLCLLLAAIAAWKSKTRLVFLALVFSFIGTIALYWSAYAPSLLIRI